MDKEEGLLHRSRGKVRYANYQGRSMLDAPAPFRSRAARRERPVLDAGRLLAAAAASSRRAGARLIFASAAGNANFVALYNDIKGSNGQVRPGRPSNCATCRVDERWSWARPISSPREKAQYPIFAGQPRTGAWRRPRAMLGADITKTRDEKEFVAGLLGHQGHAAVLADRALSESWRLEKYQLRRGRPRAAAAGNMVVGSPTDHRRLHAGDLRSRRRATVRLHAFSLFPVMFEEFGRMVVPELQRRGLFRTRICRPHHAGEFEELGGCFEDLTLRRPAGLLTARLGSYDGGIR